jgi:hypothetical protein
MHRTARAAGALAAALALAAAAGPALAQEDLRGTVDEQQKRIDALERRLKEVEGGPSGGGGADLEKAVDRYLERRRAEVREEGGGDDSYLVGLVERPSNPDFDFGGYLSVLYRSPDDRDRIPAFEGYRVVPQFAFDISEGIELATEIEFEGGGAGASYLTGNYVVIEFAEVRFHVDEAFVPKAGILLVPFMRYNLYHDDPMWNLMDRPFTATRSFRAAFQQPGVGAEGVLPFGEGHSFNYNVALTNGPDDEVDNTGFSNARQSFRTDNNHDKTVWGRFGVTPRLPFVDAADFGVSGASGELDADGHVRMLGWGVDGKVTKGRFDLIFEWCHFHYDRPATQSPLTFPHQQTAGFVQVDTHLVRGFPKSKNGLVGPASSLIFATRFEWCDTNERVTGAAIQDDCTALVFGLAFRFTPKTVVRVERRQERTRFDAPGAEDLGQWVVSLSTYF